jgi:hypothetical protein
MRHEAHTALALAMSAIAGPVLETGKKSSGSAERHAASCHQLADSAFLPMATTSYDAAATYPGTAVYTSDRRDQPAVGKIGDVVSFAVDRWVVRTVMMREPKSAPISSHNPATEADADQKVHEDLGWRTRVAGRTISRSWLVRATAAAAGLIVGWLLSRGRRARHPQRNG